MELAINVMKHTIHEFYAFLSHLRTSMAHRAHNGQPKPKLGNAFFGKEWTGNPSLTNGKFYYHTIVDSE